MIRKPITIGISNGLEARPIAMLVQVASQYSSNIYLESEAKKVNAKSIMGMMSLGLDAGESVTVSVEGEERVDKQFCLSALSSFCINRTCMCTRKTCLFSHDTTCKDDHTSCIMGIRKTMRENRNGERRFF